MRNVSIWLIDKNRSSCYDLRIRNMWYTIIAFLFLVGISAVIKPQAFYILYIEVDNQKKLKSMTTVLDLMTNILSVLDSPSDTRMVLYTGVPYNLEGGEFSILIDRAFDEETKKI